MNKLQVTQTPSTGFGSRCELKMPMELWIFLFLGYFIRMALFKKNHMFSCPFWSRMVRKHWLKCCHYRATFLHQSQEEVAAPSASSPKFMFRVGVKSVLPLRILNQAEVKKNEIKISHEPWSTKARWVRAASLIWFRGVIYVPNVAVIHQQTAWNICFSVLQWMQKWQAARTLALGFAEVHQTQQILLIHVVSRQRVFSNKTWILREKICGRLC